MVNFRDQVPDASAPGVDALNPLQQGFGFGPLQRHLRSNRAKRAQPEVLDAAEPRLERLPSAHAGIDAPVWVDSSKRAVREGPFFGVEAVAEVDEVSAESPLSAKNGLPPVTVAQPLVERENAGEFLQVLDLVKS